MTDSSDPPHPGRERTAARWRLVGICSLALALIASGGLVATEVFPLPDAVGWIAFAMAITALIAAAVAAVRYGRAHGLTRGQSLRRGIRAAWGMLWNF